MRPAWNATVAAAVLLLAFSGLAAEVAPAAAAPKAAERPPVPRVRKADLAPVPQGETANVSHAPFTDGDCSLCHQNKDPKDPGPVTGQGNDLCLGCHDDFQKLMSLKFSHGAAQERCVNCHNPHDSKRAKLLVEDMSTLCLSCHEDMKKAAGQAKVKHAALTMEGQCSNCHNPHAANVEHLLIRLPFDVCLNCHGKDDLKDSEGRPLTNFKKLLAENPERHGPVASKDCSACHNPHGGGNFRLLTHEYPPLFYSPYEPKLYALCFECHEETILTDAKTTTLTQFRDGDRNLHYLHVNKAERGRTCRACHEVHASKQKHQIRDAVPYGSKGWMLKVNFTKTPTGGLCAKTCHGEKSYTNTVAKATQP